jgi:hypothetical protein
MFQVTLECVDVRRLGSDDAPSENTDSLSCIHGGRIVSESCQGTCMVA